MSSISSNPSLFSGQAYQLSGQSTQQGGSGNASSSAAQSLLAALRRVTDTPSPSPVPSLANTGDTVSLSPQAQDLLNGLGFNSGAPAGSGFVLTSQQQQKIGDILAKYKDAPFTQDTYNKIQADLKAAGLGPDQLALEDQARHFNTTGVLLDALNGQQSPVTDLIGSGTEQSNADTYMQQIYQQWQTISTTAGAAGGSSGAST